MLSAFMTDITVSRREIDYRIEAEGSVHDGHDDIHIIVHGGKRLYTLQRHDRYMIRGTVQGQPRIYFLYCTHTGNLAEFCTQPVGENPQEQPVHLTVA